LAQAAMLRSLAGGFGRADAAFLEGRIYRRQGDVDAALRAFDEAQRGYEAAQDSAGLATTLRLIGLMYRQQGDFDAALELYDQARLLYETIGDSVGLANTLSSTSIVLRRRGNSEGARDLLTRALALTEAANDERAMSIVLNNLGLVYENLGDYDGALEAYTRSLTLKEAAGDVRGIASLLNNIGAVYLDQEAYADAQAMFERVLRLQEDLGQPAGVARALNNLGLVVSRQGDLDEALDLFERSLAIKEDLGDRQGATNSLLNLGSLHEARANYEAAETYYAQALEQYRALGIVDGEATAQLNLGTVYLAQQRLEEALESTTAAGTLADAIGALPKLRAAYEQQAAILKELGRYEEALAAHEAYKAVDDSLFTTESQSVFAEFQAQYRSEQQQQRIALLEARRSEQRLWVVLLLGGLGLLTIVVAGLAAQVRLRRKALAAVEQARRDTEEKANLLEAQAGELERANALQSRFLANISHEFRTPLTLTFGPLDDLLDGRYHVEEAARPHLQRARHNGGRLLRLINQLLDLSKLDAGALLLRPAHQDLAGHLRQITALFGSVAQRRRIAFKVEGVEQPHAFVYDADKIEKVVVNLLSNAFKFTQPGGTISLVLIKDDEGTNGGVRIEVADSGQGIPSDAAPLLFDRFYQVESGTTRAQEGTGIGLALVKELVELHGGTIAVESTEGIGTTFTVTFPTMEARADAGFEGDGHGLDTGARESEPVGLGASDLDTDTSWAVEEVAELRGGGEAVPLTAVEDTEEQEGGTGEEDEAPESLVLVVEDNADMRAYIRSHLDDRAVVVEAENGRVGVERALELVPDLVVSDVMMPDLDGLDFTAALKADARTSHIPVLLLTARAEVADRIAGYESGADAYLPKPFSAAELRVRVRTLIAERRRLWARFRAAAEHPSPTEALTSNGDGATPHRNGATHDTPEPAQLPPREAMFVADVHALVTERLADPAFGVDALAEALAMSSRQLLRKLRALTGETTVGLLRRRRLERAASALASGADSVKAVAFEVGFANESAFSRAFSQHFGVAPSAYAEQHQTDLEGSASDTSG
ncbi:MAG: tetratricopeptide repeat protein, partial [Bacteroidota bacterium]